uniref:Glucagon / GIP / secretin / VIP family domain-containing protein n=1 Tax=Calidris pygmaea TaxID=425635 RepID=A0A8C3JR98_9CHAR
TWDGCWIYLMLGAPWPGLWQESPSTHGFVANTKRHSEGTFTSDFTRYLDKMKAKDFVHWLINTKRFR